MNGSIAAIVAADMLVAGQQQYLLSALITSDLLAAGTYLLTAEVQDPDNNRFQYKTTQEIRVE